MRILDLISLFLAFLLISTCGGGGGGGGGGDTPTGEEATSDSSSGGDPSKNNPSISAAPSYPYPNIKADPYFVGDQLDFDGKTFEITRLDGKTIRFNTSGRQGTYYEFPTSLSYQGTRFVPIAMGDRYGIGASVYVYEAGLQEKAEWFFTLDGNWTANPPTSGLFRYYGEYESINAQGQSNGVFPILMNVNFENIESSSGADLVSGEDIYIFFSDIDGTSISGTISDQNGDQNPASFGLFGPGAQTIIGGYANPLGNGLFIGQQK